MRIKRTRENAMLPTRGTEDAAGIDLYAAIEDRVEIMPGEVVMIPSGIAVEIPKRHYGLLVSRSSVASKRGLCLATGASIIDADYRGEIGIPIRNCSNEAQAIYPSDRIAQLIISCYTPVGIDEIVDGDLSETRRGSGGFGSTGR